MAKNTTIKRNGKEYSYFRITRTVGHEYKEGKRVPIKKQFIGSSERDAERKYREWLMHHEEQSVFDSTRTFGDLSEFYTDNILSVNSKYAVSTRQLYAGAYEKYIRRSVLTDLTMSSIRSEDIQQFYNDLDVTHSAMKNVHKYMRGFMLWQSRNKYGDYLMDTIAVPAKRIVRYHEGVIVWTDEELDKILSTDHPLSPFIMFAAYTGMRMSELLGLKWSDIDEVIHVRRQCYKGSWCPPKGNKERIIPLHEKLKAFVDRADKENELVFTTASGLPLDQKNINRSLDRLYKRLGIEHKKFHAYRATFITNLCKRGVPIQTASKIAGHSSVDVTARYYTSIGIDEMTEAVNKL